MNRKIKFRGKRQGDGAWIYGENIHAFILDENGEKIWTIHPSGEPATHEGDGYIKFKPYIVDPDTVGQFSGIELSSHELYEGDILEIDVLYDDSIIEKIRGVVDFNIGFFSFHEIGEKSMKWILSQIASLSMGVEYLGNIHDNPELLEKKG